MNKKASAFSLFETLMAMALFAAVLPVTVKCFLSQLSMPKIDDIAVALIADVDNCVTNINEVKLRKNQPAGDRIQCLLLPNKEFFVFKDEINRSTSPRPSSANLFKVLLSQYPNSKANHSAFYYKFN